MNQKSGELIPLTALAERLSLHPDTVRGLHRRGKIPGLRIGHRTLRFDYGAVLDALERDQANSGRTATQ